MTTTPEQFLAAITALSALPSADKPLGPNFGVAIAVLLHRAGTSRPRIGEVGVGAAVFNAELEGVCNDTWRKEPSFLPHANSGPILKPFVSDSFKPEANNNWRNSFAAQTGLGCHAPTDEQHLLSEDFLGEPRSLCHFRNGVTGACGAAAFPATCFNTNKGGLPPVGGRGLDRPKLLVQRQVQPNIAQYWAVAPTRESLEGLLGKSRRAVPAEPFARALFAGSEYWSGPDTPERLHSELGLSDTEFFTLFAARSEAALSSGADEGIVAEKDGAGEVSQSDASVPAAALPAPIDFVPRAPKVMFDYANQESDPERRARLLEHAWGKHQSTLIALAAWLSDNGFSVDEQLGGYDLCAKRAGEAPWLFEVKSWTPANLASQVRSGWAQLHEYAYRNRAILGPEAPRLCLVLDRRPPANFWAWQWFAETGQPVVCWLGEHGLESFEAFQLGISLGGAPSGGSPGK